MNAFAKSNEKWTNNTQEVEKMKGNVEINKLDVEKHTVSRKRNDGDNKLRMKLKY